MKTIIVGILLLASTTTLLIADDKIHRSNENVCIHNDIKFTEGATICYFKGDDTPSIRPHACTKVGDGGKLNPIRYSWVIISNVGCS